MAISSNSVERTSSLSLRYNLFLSVVVLLYTRLAVAVGDYLVRRRYISGLTSRKLVHLAATCTLLFWPLFDDSSSSKSGDDYGWSWRFNTLTGTIYCIQLIFQGLVFPNPNDPEVKAMTRTGDPKELLVGPLMFGLVLVYVGHVAFRKELSTYLMASLGFGDGVAPLVGYTLPRGRYLSWGNEMKTTSGSIGMFFGTILGYFLLQWILGAPETLDISRLVGLAATATLAEAASGPYDNLAITAAVCAYLRATDLSSR